VTPGTVFGLGGCALLIAAAAGLALRATPLAARWRALLVAAVFGAAWLPAGGLPVAAYLRGVTGDLSVTTLLLLAASVATTVSGRRVLARREHAIGCAAIVAAAAYLYPMALGIGPFDPYALGYASTPFAVALALLGLLAWWARFYRLLWALVAAAAAFIFGPLDSANLWDYLVDPLVAVYALLWLVQAGLRAAVQAIRASGSPPAPDSTRPMR